MTRIILYLLLLILGNLSVNAQQIIGRIVDSQSNAPIAYATIRVEDVDFISNDNGYFALSGENLNEATLLGVSFIGYAPQNISVGHLKSNNNIIRLNLIAYDIGETYVSNLKPDPNEIMKLVNERLTENYGDFNYKYRIFTRESTLFKPKTLEVNIKKSTGYSKSELKTANEEVRQFNTSLLKNPPQEFTDILSDYYSRMKEIEGKNIPATKAIVIKGVILKDENRSTSFDDIEKSALHTLTKHLDTTKFYRIKSGLIGSRDTISFSEEYNKQQAEKRRKKNKSKVPTHKNLSNVKNKIFFFNHYNANLRHSNFSFVNKPELYRYNYVNTTYIDDELVYVLDFSPKKSKAKHIGKIYISHQDYAVLRVDYALAEGKNLNGINLKLLLGIKVFENVHRGNLLFKKNTNTNKYYLHYSSQEEGQYFYINRPLKLIEINKNRSERELLSFNIKVEGNVIDKTEYLNMEVQPITESEFESIQEKEFDYQIHKSYNPNIWKGYNVIEPLEELKNFKTVE